MCLYNILVSGFYHHQSSLCYLSVSWSYVTLYIYRYVLEGPGTTILSVAVRTWRSFKKNVYRHVAFFFESGWVADLHVSEILTIIKEKKIYLPNFKIQIWGGGEGRHLNILIQCEFVFLPPKNGGGRRCYVPGIGK